MIQAWSDNWAMDLEKKNRWKPRSRSQERNLTIWNCMPPCLLCLISNAPLPWLSPGWLVAWVGGVQSTIPCFGSESRRSCVLLAIGISATKNWWSSRNMYVRPTCSPPLTQLSLDGRPEAEGISRFHCKWKESDAGVGSRTRKVPELETHPGCNRPNTAERITWVGGAD